LSISSLPLFKPCRLRELTFCKSNAIVLKVKVDNIFYFTNFRVLKLVAELLDDGAELVVCFVIRKR
jgi:hypothetical protein